MLYRIFDPNDSGAALVTVSYNVDKDETQQATCEDIFRLSHIVSGASFLKPQKMKIQAKDLVDSY